MKKSLYWPEVDEDQERVEYGQRKDFSLRLMEFR